MGTVTDVVFEDIEATKPKKRNNPHARKDSPIAPRQTVRPDGTKRKVQPPALTNRYIIPKELITGRPTTYNMEIHNAIVRWISEGKSLVTFCKIEGMPDISTVYDWLRRHPDFSQAYARAKEDQADVFAEQMQAISDEAYHEVQNADGTVTMLPIDVQRSRLQVDTRKWIAAKLKPKKYGERIIHAGDETAPLVTQMVLDSEALAEKLRRR